MAFDAFFELSSERSIGMAEGRIPASKVRAFAVERAGCESEDEVDDFASLIHAMDNAYLARADTPAQVGAKNTVKANDRHGLIGLLQKVGGGKTVPA